ncbi:MAG TPA: hypothetical protein VI968_03130 [archaeon]|nr:hypothetical protein [archaeon]
MVDEYRTGETEIRHAYKTAGHAGAIEYVGGEGGITVKEFQRQVPSFEEAAGREYLGTP